MQEKSNDFNPLPVGCDGDRALIDEAYLCVMSDPENYSTWQYEFINDIRNLSKDRSFSLSRNQRFYVQKILDKEN